MLGRIKTIVNVYQAVRENIAYMRTLKAAVAECTQPLRDLVDKDNAYSQAADKVKIKTEFISPGGYARISVGTKTFWVGDVFMVFDRGGRATKMTAELRGCWKVECETPHDVAAAFKMYLTDKEPENGNPSTARPE